MIAIIKHIYEQIADVAKFTDIQPIAQVSVVAA